MSLAERKAAVKLWVDTMPQFRRVLRAVIEDNPGAGKGAVIEATAAALTEYARNYPNMCAFESDILGFGDNVVDLANMIFDDTPEAAAWIREAAKLCPVE